MDSLSRLVPFLRAASPPHRLRQLGLYDYIGHDAVARDPAREVAAEALLYLGCRDGRYTGANDVVTGVVSYLMEETGQAVTQNQLVRLADILKADPVDPEAVREWFRSVC